MELCDPRSQQLTRQLRNIWHGNRKTGKDNLVTGFATVDDFVSKNDFDGAGHAAAGHLPAVFLDANFLPVTELGASNVKVPVDAVHAGRVGARGGLGVDKVLLDVLDDGTTVHALEAAVKELRSDF